MQRPLTVHIDGKPRPQDRPRAAVIKGHAVMYDAKQSKDAKKEVAEIVKLAMEQQKWEPITEGALTLIVTSYFPIPKHFKKQEHADAVAGKIRPTSKPDADNLAKLYMDAITQAGAYRDDAQIVDLLCYKYYGENPGVDISLAKAEVCDG